MEKKNNARYFWTKWGEYASVYPNYEVQKAWMWEPEEQNTEVLNITLYPKDIHISDRKKRNPMYVHSWRVSKKRSVIQKYSFRANKRCKFYLRNTAYLMEVIATLTYPKDFPMDGALVKKHLHKFVGWLSYHKYKYIWVLEFQERGAPHFHFLLDRKIPHQDVAKIWYRIVGSGDPKHLEAGTEVRAIRAKGSIAYYLTKYMDKAGQKEVPQEYMKVGRFWSHSKDLLQGEVIKIYGS
jgi:hypothetical protein